MVSFKFIVMPFFFWLVINLNCFIAEIKVVFVDNFERLSNILENINEFPHLQLIVHFDKLTYSQVDQLKNYNLENVQVLSYKDLMVSGRENLISPKVMSFYLI